MVTSPATFGDTRVQFGDTRIDWAGNWLDGGVTPPVDSWILRCPSVPESLAWQNPQTLEQRAQNRLMRFFEPRRRELNVYRLVDGSYTTRQPWDPNRIAKAWFGGHVNLVDAEERDGLRDAGFTVDDIE